MLEQKHPVRHPTGNKQQMVLVHLMLSSPLPLMVDTGCLREKMGKPVQDMQAGTQIFSIVDHTARRWSKTVHFFYRHAAAMRLSKHLNNM